MRADVEAALAVPRLGDPLEGLADLGETGFCSGCHHTKDLHLFPDTCSVLTHPDSFVDDVLETETASNLLGRGGPITHHDCLRDSPSPSLEQPSELSETDSWPAFAQLLASLAC